MIQGKNILIVSIGTRGDVQPFIVLALEFLKNQNQVTIACHEELHSFVHQYGIQTSVIHGSLSDSFARQIKPSFSQTKEIFYQCMKLWIQDLHSLMSSTKYDIVLFSSLGVLVGTSVIEAVLASDANMKRDAKSIWFAVVRLFPEMPTKHFPPVLMGYQDESSGWVNNLKWSVAAFFEGILMGGALNKLRKEILNLSPLKISVKQQLRMMKVTQINAFSKYWLPQSPTDWPETEPITGQLILPPKWKDSDLSTIPSQLVQFLSQGSAPVYIGFGSMTYTFSEEKIKNITDSCIEALKNTNQRGIILMSTANTKEESWNISENILAIKSAPHDWLFPKCSVVVHHGGVGTLTAAVLAGKVSVFVTFGADQPFWGSLMYKRGMSPTPIKSSELTSSTLATCITEALNNQQMQQNINLLQQQLQKEEGMVHAMQVLEGSYSKSKQIQIVTKKPSSWWWTFGMAALAVAGAVYYHQKWM